MMPEAAATSGSLAEVSGLAAEFHRWPLPAYIWPALNHRYQSVFCSEPHLRVTGGLKKNLQVWVARHQGHITDIFLFEINGRVARLVNEMHEIAIESLEKFTQFLSLEYPQIDALCLHAVFLKGVASQFPVMQTEFSEDYILRLPESTAKWHALLSPRTREKLRYYYRRSCRKQPDLIFRQIRADQITKEQFHRIVQMNRDRMAGKGRSFIMTKKELNELYLLMQECGQLSVIEINGNISAGLICTKIGQSIFMHVIAHDPKHDDLRLGFLCCALSIEAAVSEGMKQFHFLWGYYDYKTRLGGQRQALYRAVIFRSRWRVLIHPDLLVGQVAQKARNKIRHWRRT